MAQSSGKKARSVVRLSMVPRRLPSPSQTPSHRGSRRPGPTASGSSSPPARTGKTDPDGIVGAPRQPLRDVPPRSGHPWLDLRGGPGRLPRPWVEWTRRAAGPWSATCLHRVLKVVAFDGLSHGRSDAGVHGPRSSDAVELGRSLDAVAAKFGPARAVVAHSMGALSALLALRDGWLATERLVLIAPVEGVPDFLARFRATAALRSADGATSHRAPSSARGTRGGPGRGPARRAARVAA